MSKIVTVAKADRVWCGETVEDVRIDVNAELPTFDRRKEPVELNAWLERVGAWYDEQARMIEEGLYESLPGGTYDRLLGRMLARKASHFRVRHA